MAISKPTLAALRLITALDVDVKRTYKAERQWEILSARLQGAPSDYAMWDQQVQNGEHRVPVRLFAPPGEGPFPVLLFFHGGGWVTGGIENYTGLCVELCKATGHTVASVDYRLAPEHPFPAGLSDCYAVARAFFQGSIPGAPARDITLVGDSAGGNIAAAVSLMARDRGEFQPGGQVLLYPVTNNQHGEHSPFPSIRENGTGYLLTAQRVQRLTELYASGPADWDNPYFAPLLAKDLSGQPRTLVISAEYDPLRDEGEAYGYKLMEAGTEATVYRMKDALHAFMMMPPRYPPVKRAHRLIRAFLAKRNGHDERHQNLE